MEQSRIGFILTFAVLSSEAVIRCLLSSEKFTQRTAPACPFIVTDSPLLYVRSNVKNVDASVMRERFAGRSVLRNSQNEGGVTVQ